MFHCFAIYLKDEGENRRLFSPGIFSTFASYTQNELICRGVNHLGKQE
jgi:hypothetical protein